jgi:GGDEF domain-containing protein
MLTCNETEAQAKAEELKVAFGRDRSATSVPEYVGLSIGVAPVPRGADTLREAIRYADSRMYRDKLALRGQVAL